jgi:DNA-binding response OmpR family regulator
MRILIVEDEKKLAENIKEKLQLELFSVDWVADGEIGLDQALIEEYDLIILDIMLPKKTGLAILRELRDAKMTTPVLLLTALSRVEDKVKGLDLGADDYLTKPFAMAELLARVRLLLRRTGNQKSSCLDIADLILNTKTHEVFRNNQLLDLTPKEYAILEFMLYNKNHTLSRLTIAEHVWGYNVETMTNFVDVHIKNLRQKIDNQFSPKLIHTIRGIGYLLRES